MYSKVLFLATFIPCLHSFLFGQFRFSPKLIHYNCETRPLKCVPVVSPNSDRFQQMPDRQYESVKLALIGDLVQIYWERVMLYALVKRETGLEWTDLVVHVDYGVKLSQKQAYCMTLAEAVHPELDPLLITAVYEFIRDNILTAPAYRVTHETISSLLQDVSAFCFKEDDPDQQLAMELRNSIEYHHKNNCIPTDDELRATLQSVTTISDIYISFAKRFPSKRFSVHYP